MIRDLLYFKGPLTFKELEGLLKAPIPYKYLIELIEEGEIKEDELTGSYQCLTKVEE